jgi:hypothetical protein
MADPTNRSLFRLVLYYAALVAATLGLERVSPAVQAAVSPTEGVAAPHRATLGVALAMSGALALVIPVAWVYMLTKRRQRWDPSVVQTVILLPLAVAGIAALVRNSLALAFSLAGLAAAVRFRNTLKDTKDAVYIFLAIAVGLAAGVQALELGFVVSGLFNATVLGLWALNVGDIYAAEPGPTFTREFRIAHPEGEQGTLVAQADGAGQERLETALGQHVRHWRLARREAGAGNRSVLSYSVQLKKRTTPAALLAAISFLGVTAEFHPVSDEGGQR